MRSVSSLRRRCSITISLSNYSAMQTPYGHLTYCTNIHGGEAWADHFAALRENVPLIKAQVTPGQPMGIGLRLSDRASRDLTDPQALAAFQAWLAANDAYVFTMNGFPFGAFHGDVVKANVHAPDWTTEERLTYTLRLFDLLAELLPEGMDGGISTSPLAYRHWYNATADGWRNMRRLATRHVVDVAAYLIAMERDTGKTLHLDIEPEPDGVLESGPEFISWFTEELVPQGIAILAERFGFTPAVAEETLKKHIRLCYDVCHFALGYEDHAAVISELGRHAIRIGKLQLSAAVAARLPADYGQRQAVGEAFKAFDEPTYLHQVLAKKRDGSVLRFPDLPEALAQLDNDAVTEWRAHFHVPVFFEKLGLLTSTQEDIRRILQLQQDGLLTPHMEVETYTWEVLPRELQLPVAGSISRELNWVLNALKNS